MTDDWLMCQIDQFDLFRLRSYLKSLRTATCSGNTHCLTHRFHREPEQNQNRTSKEAELSSTELLVSRVRRLVIGQQSEINLLLVSRVSSTRYWSAEWGQLVIGQQWVELPAVSEWTGHHVCIALVAVSAGCVASSQVCSAAASPVCCWRESGMWSIRRFPGTWTSCLLKVWGRPDHCSGSPCWQDVSTDSTCRTASCSQVSDTQHQYCDCRVQDQDQGQTVTRLITQLVSAQEAVCAMKRT